MLKHVYRPACHPRATPTRKLKFKPFITHSTICTKIETPFQLLEACSLMTVLPYSNMVLLREYQLLVVRRLISIIIN